MTIEKLIEYLSLYPKDMEIVMDGDTKINCIEIKTTMNNIPRASLVNNFFFDLPKEEVKYLLTKEIFMNAIEAKKLWESPNKGKITDLPWIKNE